METHDLSSILNWLHCLPNKDLQRLNTETNRILMARYDEELKQSNEYQANMATALYLLGHRQTKDTVQCIISKLEKTSDIHFKFDALISKLKRRLSNDTDNQTK